MEKVKTNLLELKERGIKEVLVGFTIGLIPINPLEQSNPFSDDENKKRPEGDALQAWINGKYMITSDVPEGTYSIDDLKEGYQFLNKDGEWKDMSDNLSERIKEKVKEGNPEVRLIVKLKKEAEKRILEEDKLKDRAKAQLEKEIREAYIFLRGKNTTIPSETLQFMLDASLEKLKTL